MIKSVGRHVHLAIYLVTLAVVWAVSLATARIGTDGHVELSSAAQAVQYLLVVLAATLAGDRLIRSIGDRPADDGAALGFYDYRWTIERDTPSRVMWICLWAGAAAMVVNVGVLIVADLVVGDVGLPAAVGTYAGWLGAAVAAGIVLGIFSAAIPLLMARLARAFR